MRMADIHRIKLSLVHGGDGILRTKAEKWKRWYNKHRDRENKKECERARLKDICTTRNGKNIHIRGNKRLFPSNNKCEICGKDFGLYFSYHHWDDKDLMKGMWTCKPCNTMADKVEEGLHIKYLESKERILKNQ